MKLKKESEHRIQDLRDEAARVSVPLSQAELDAYLGGEPDQAELEALEALS